MGILELHFHDSEFVFGPSIGGDDAVESAEEAVGEMIESDDESTRSPALAAVVGLLFALVLAVLAKKVGGGEDHDGVEIEELEP